MTEPLFSRFLDSFFIFTAFSRFFSFSRQFLRSSWPKRRRSGERDRQTDGQTDRRTTDGRTNKHQILGTLYTKGPKGQKWVFLNILLILIKIHISGLIHESSREGGSPKNIRAANPLHRGGMVFPRLLSWRFLRAPSIESFMVGFFGKLMDETVAKNIFFRNFFLKFFSQPPKMWWILSKSVNFYKVYSTGFIFQ